MIRGIPRLNLVLFLVTCFTTLVAGALNSGVNIISEPLLVYKGFPFALSIMLILLSHEFSHYYASYAHHTEATLPYFIPGPSIIGTFGAVIKMKSPIHTRKALVDIGASGPIAGFLVSVVITIIGLLFSTVATVPPPGEGLTMGDSLIFLFFEFLVFGPLPDGSVVYLHPVAFAGWVGLFITSLNLLPIGQLDGGHIVYALYGPRAHTISRVLALVLLVCGILWWEGWALWAVLMYIIGLKHPPVTYWERELDPVRGVIAIISLIIFALTFTPKPFDF